MADLRHKLGGLVISEPRNWRDLDIVKDFLNKKDEDDVNIADIEFAGDIAIEIKKRILNGLSGGIGVFEGDPYDIEVGEQGSPVYTFNGYLDYADGVEFSGCNEVKVSLKKRNGSNWLNDVADGFSFRYLYEIGVINDSDFIKVPYVINYVPDNMQLILLSLSLYMMTKELIEVTRDIADSIAEIINASTPNVGFGVTYDVGDVIWVALKTVARIAYAIAIIIAIKNLIEDILEQLLPKKRFHLGMSIYTLFERACSHLGLGFSSKLLSDRSNWVVIPSKDHRGGEKPTEYVGSWTEKGVPSLNDPFDTFGDLIRVWKEGLNADYKIVNGVFEFERRDYWNRQSTFVIKDYFNDQNDLKDVYSLNVDEVVSNYAISWSYDSQDQNTLDNQSGRLFQAILEPNVKTNADLINLKNIDDRLIPCSLGVEKNNLTRVEEVAKALGSFVDKVTGVFGGGTNFASKIDERKGSLLMSSHFLTIPKVVVMNGSKLANSQRDLLSSTRLFNELHFINSFAEINGEHNQYYRFKNLKIKFCEQDFLALLDSHFCKTENGEDAMIELLRWKAWQDFAIIDYRVKKKYTDNLTVKFI